MVSRLNSLKFKFFHRRPSSASSSSDYKQQESYQEHRLILYEWLPAYDSESNQFVDKFEIPIEYKLIEIS